MSQGTSRLVQFGGGVFVLIFLPIFIVIALLFAALSGVEDAAACTPVSDASSTFGFPVANHNPSARFQHDGVIQHHGVDFPAEAGEEVKSVAAGTVIAVDGNLVKVRNEAPQTTSPAPAANDDLGESWYRYIRNPAVHVGDHVTAGQRLAEVGTSNEPNGATGNHLHFEVHVDGEPRDPMDFFTAQDQQASGVCGCGSGSLVGSNNQQKVFNYFVSRGYTKEQAAGILGNMIHESGVEPKKQEGGATISSAQAVGSGLGWGIVQWTPPSNMINPTHNAGKSYEEIDTLEHQVDFLYNQLEGNSPIPEVGPGDALKRARTVDDATVAFAGFERFDGWENPNHPRYIERKQAAREAFNLYGGGAQGGPGTGCGAGGDFVQTARNLAWPDQGHGPDKSDAKAEYQQGMPRFNGTPDNADQPYSDCGVFVATVVRMTGADPNYPTRGTGVQLAYVRNHPERYEVFQPTNTSQLQPGDIFIIADSADGHTYIYTGNYEGSDGRTYNAVSASWHTRVPQASNAYFTGSEGGGPYTVARLKSRA
jgi:biotin carboxyl carrier protein